MGAEGTPGSPSHLITILPQGIDYTANPSTPTPILG